MWNEIVTEVETLLALLKTKAESAISIFLSFMGEAVTEEEAALWPQFKALAIQIFNDETKISGLDVPARVVVVVTDFSAQLPADVALAKNALINSWAWAVAYQTGQINGNQGNLPGGNTGATQS